VRKISLRGEDPVKSVPSGEWCLAPEPAATSAAGDDATPAPVPPGIRIEEHTHAKKGFRMWIAILPKRVDRAEFERLRDLAQAMGGWYSRPWQGTPGGFAFKDPEAARAFASPAPAGDDAAAPGTPEVPTAAPGAAIAERLRSLADGLESDIANKL